MIALLLFIAAEQVILPTEPLTNAVPQVIVLPSVDSLRARKSKGQVALVSDYYGARAHVRGGGTFVWREGVSARDDGGHWIVPKEGTGVWERVLNGQSANVMMFGAVGDGIFDDTFAISNAVYACRLGFSGELMFPAGEYVLSETIIFGVGVHLHGESRNQSRIMMKSDKDVFRSFEADQVIQNEFTNINYYYDEDISIEDLTINLPMDGTNGAALVVKQPGEALSIRGLHINGGGWGVKVLGMGEPGLRVHDCAIANQYHAAIQVDGWLGTNWCGHGGPMMILGFSTDNRRADAAEGVSALFLNHVYGPVTIIGMKAEGQYGGGLVRYLYSEGTPGIGSGTLGAIHISESTYNHGGVPWIPHCDFLVLQSDGPKTASAILQNITPVGVRWLIQDDVTGSHIANSAGYLQGTKDPVFYASSPFIVPTKRLDSPKGTGK